MKIHPCNPTNSPIPPSDKLWKANEISEREGIWIVWNSPFPKNGYVITLVSLTTGVKTALVLGENNILYPIDLKDIVWRSDEFKDYSFKRLHMEVRD